MYHDFSDGTWASHLPKKNHLFFALYGDEINICNPIGQAKSKHKLFVFYVQILNVPARLRSRIVTIFPLAIVYSHALRPNACAQLDLLLKNFTDCLNQLSFQGIVFNVSGESCLVHGHLIAFIGDSLAANFIGGFKEGFSPKVLRCCRACNCTRNEMIATSTLSMEKMRSAVEHSIRVQEVTRNQPEMFRLFWSRLYGVNQPSALRDVPGFSVTDCILFDPMHDILEGLFPIQMELLLHAHTTAGMYTLEEFNEFLRVSAPFTSRDKPNVVRADKVLVAKQTSGQMLSMLRILKGFGLLVKQS
jgi:hypothetical protein